MPIISHVDYEHGEDAAFKKKVSHQCITISGYLETKAIKYGCRDLLQIWKTINNGGCLF